VQTIPHALLELEPSHVVSCHWCSCLVVVWHLLRTLLDASHCHQMNSQLCVYSFGMTMQKFEHPTFTSENRGVVWCLVKQGLGKYNCTTDKGMNKDISCHNDGLQRLILHMGLTRQKRCSLSLNHITVYNLNKESRFKSQFFVAERGLKCFKIFRDISTVLPCWSRLDFDSWAPAGGIMLWEIGLCMVTG
jgi:hypothetical protein